MPRPKKSIKSDNNSSNKKYHDKEQTESSKSNKSKIPINKFALLMDEDDEDNLQNNVTDQDNLQDNVQDNEQEVKVVASPKQKRSNRSEYKSQVRKMDVIDSNDQNDEDDEDDENAFEEKSSPNNDDNEVEDNEDNEEEDDEEEETNTKKRSKVYVPPSASSGDDSWSSSSSYMEKKRKNRVHKEKEPELEYYDPEQKYPGDDMKLNSLWRVWIHNNNNINWDIDSYESIYEIDSIGSMWRFLSVFDNLDKNYRQYYIMREGITPIWEDNNNKDGAICSIMVENMNRYNRHSRGDLGVDAFTAMCILVMNESFVKNNMDINGLCYSIKNRNVLIKFWVKNFEQNKDFINNLPVSILKTLDSIITNIEHRYSVSRVDSGKSRVSVQIKQIKPDH